jgi:hypothetical protein
VALGPVKESKLDQARMQWHGAQLSAFLSAGSGIDDYCGNVAVFDIAATKLR